MKLEHFGNYSQYYKKMFEFVSDNNSGATCCCIAVGELKNDYMYIYVITTIVTNQ